MIWLPCQEKVQIAIVIVVAPGHAASLYSWGGRPDDLQTALGGERRAGEGAIDRLNTPGIKAGWEAECGRYPLVSIAQGNHLAISFQTSTTATRTGHWTEHITQAGSAANAKVITQAGGWSPIISRSIPAQFDLLTINRAA